MTKNKKRSSTSKNRLPSRYTNVKELKPEIIPTRGDVSKVYNSLMSNNRRVGSDNDVYTTLVPYEIGVSSDSSGNVSNVFSNDPNNSSYWTTISSNFEQWRVFGIRVEFIPNTITGGTTTIYKSPFVYVTDFDSSAVLTSYLTARTFSNCREVPSTRQFSLLAVEDDTSGANWNDVLANPPVNSLWVKFFGSGFTASTPLGRVTVDYIVQFKNRGL